MIDVFLVHDDVERCATIKTALQGLPDLNLICEKQTGREGIFAATTMLTGHPRMLIVRLNLGDMTGFDFIAQVQQKAPDIYIVPALDGTEGGQVWQTLLQLELRDVIVGPVPSSEINKVLQSASVRSEERFRLTKSDSGNEGDSYVISIVGARGGIGKSVIATNIASALAKRTDSVLLLDMSLYPGDFAVFLDDVPRNNIMDAVNQGGSLDSDFLRHSTAKHPQLGFQYMACPNQEFDSSGFDYNVGDALVKASREVCQYTVIDTGAAMAGPTIAAIDNSDIVFFVSTRDVARLLASKNYIKYIKQDRQLNSQKLKVLLNQAEIGAEISESEIESLLEHPVAAYLPCNAGPVTFSINTGAPIVTAEPHQPISAVLDKLAELCFCRWDESNKNKDKEKAKKGGLLGSARFSQRLSIK